MAKAKYSKKKVAHEQTTKAPTMLSTSGVEGSLLTHRISGVGVMGRADCGAYPDSGWFFGEDSQVSCMVCKELM